MIRAVITGISHHLNVHQQNIKQQIVNRQMHFKNKNHYRIYFTLNVGNTYTQSFTHTSER